VKSTDLESRQNSQNGEDGIIAHLVGLIHDSQYINPFDRQFVEIGCGSGRENCTTALAIAGWRGVVIDRKPARVVNYKAYAQAHGFADRVDAYAVAATRSAGPELIELFETDRPCFFSLDIDGPDWHVMKGLLEAGFRPDVCCLEYNAAYELQPITARYEGIPKVSNNLHYGAGVVAWRRLMAAWGYEFVTVESAGVNCFFVRAESVDMDEIAKIEGLDWIDCAAFAKRYGNAWERFGKIAHKYTFDHVNEAGGLG